MKRFSTLIMLFSCLCFVAMLSYGTAVAKQDGEVLEKVTLRMNWFPYADYAAYIIGIKKGFYRDEGIEVEVIPTKGSGLTTKLIANREGEFAGASADAVLTARTKGMPLKVLATLHQTSPVSIFSLQSQNIKNPKDLEGKSIASDPSSMKHQQFVAFCQKQGIDIEKIRIIPIAGSNFIHILEGKADSMLAFGYIGDALLRKKGHAVNEMKLNDYGVDMYSISLITHDDLISENPDLVKRFVSATVKSWDYAASHVEEAVDAYVEAYPDLKKDNEMDQVRGVVELMQSQYTKQYGYGYQSKEKWEATQDLLYEQGLIDKKIDINEVYTNKFLPKK
ncbi:MAG: ABC transporter substrate-binding protein [Candidatus Omnitrophica bacterium]|nr:ABC transporter substrate-binding protein [Candidatus Omnitrophota bacterium]